MRMLRIAAFSDGERGGNPAGVLLAAELPSETGMQGIARDLGFSETAFASPSGPAWRVRYFSPESEVPFCGHATIALGVALAQSSGDGVFRLILNHAEITVEGRRRGSELSASLQSPPTRSEAVGPELVGEALSLFGYSLADLDPRLPPARIHGGADHLLLGLLTRESLAAMSYELDAGRDFMRRQGFVTVSLVFAESERRFHARNPFASGGIYEDPATGAAAAALGGYLRDIGWPHGGSIEILQGEDMGSPSRLLVDIPPQTGSSIRVSGTARFLD